MAVSTGVTGVNAAGEAFVYQPPKVVPVTVGNTVVYGSYQQITAGEEWPPSTGVWQVGGGSGASTVVDAVTYRQVTITPL